MDCQIVVGGDGGDDVDPGGVCCRRQGQPLELIVSWLEKSICRGQARDALYCAAELDLSGWSMLFWERIFWIGWAHIGLANPLVPMALLDLHKRWLEALEQAESCPTESSFECLKARCIVMLTVNWLVNERKNQLILHCSSACILETTGCLSDDDWHQKLGTSRRLKAALGPIRLRSCAAEEKAMVCLCRSMVENNEDRTVRMVNLLHVWGKSELVWMAAEKLCDVNTSDMFAWAKEFVRLYKDAWLFGLETRRNHRVFSLLTEMARCHRLPTRNGETPTDHDIDPERLPLFQIMLLLSPGRNYRSVFPEGVHPNSLSGDKIRKWEGAAEDTYSSNHKKLAPPEFVRDKTTLAGTQRGKSVEDYLNSGLRVTNFMDIVDPLFYYDRAYRGFITAEQRYGAEHTTYDALERLRKSGALRDGLQSHHPSEELATKRKRPPSPSPPSSESPEHKAPQQQQQQQQPITMTTDAVTPPSPKRPRLTTTTLEMEEGVFDDPTMAGSDWYAGYYAKCRGRRVFVDGPFCGGADATHRPDTIAKHAKVIHTLKKLFLGIDHRTGHRHDSLTLLRSTVLSLRVATCDPFSEGIRRGDGGERRGIFVVTDDPRFIGCEDEEEEEEEDDDIFAFDAPSCAPVTPSLMMAMESERRTEVHSRFLSALAFRCALWIPCEEQTNDFLLNQHTGTIYSLRERQIGVVRPASPSLKLLRGGSRRWEKYVNQVLLSPEMLEGVKKRCLRWKGLLETPAVHKSVFEPIGLDAKIYADNLGTMATQGAEFWKTLMYCKQTSSSSSSPPRNDDVHMEE